jgi:hypothetical protein
MPPPPSERSCGRGVGRASLSRPGEGLRRLNLSPQGKALSLKLLALVHAPVVIRLTLRLATRRAVVSGHALAIVGGAGVRMTVASRTPRCRVPVSWAYAVATLSPKAIKATPKYTAESLILSSKDQSAPPRCLDRQVGSSKRRVAAWAVKYRRQCWVALTLALLERDAGRREAALERSANRCSAVLTL